MVTEEKKKKPHNIILENRRSMMISGVIDVDSFDEQTVILFTDLGELTVRGDNLHIDSLNIDSGEMAIEGEINSFNYSDVQRESGGFFSKLFK